MGRIRFGLIPRDERFLEMLGQSADNVATGAEALVDLVEHYVDVDRKVRRLKDIEHAAGGWRIVRTLGMRITGLRTVQGFAAETSAATVLQLASWLGVPVSTTHAITSAIVGAGTVHGRKEVRWEVVGEIGTSWVLTLPASVGLGYGYGLLFQIVLD